MPGRLVYCRVRAQAGHAPWRRVGGKDLLNLQARDLGFDLRLEFVGGAAQFGEKLSRLTSHLRQLLRPKKNEHQEEQEDRVGKTHGHIIMRRGKGGNATRLLRPTLPVATLAP